MGTDTIAQAPVLVGPSVAGTPVVYVSGAIVVVLLTFAGTWVGSLVTVAHEGGHIVVAILTLRKPRVFHVNETTGGGETLIEAGWGAGLILSVLAGYLTPPLVGLAGANLLLAGKAWSLLWASVILLFGAYFKAKNLFTILIVTLAGAGIGWTAIRGWPELQAGVAVGLVWLMLIGSVRSLVALRFGGDGSDAAILADNTLIPRILWVALFWFVAIVCLWVGGRRLLGV
jgi:Peptidase M50B-like